MENENSKNIYVFNKGYAGSQKNRVNTNSNLYYDNQKKENFNPNGNRRNNKTANNRLNGANNDINIIFQTIWAYDYLRNFNAENQNFNFLKRFCNQEKLNVQEKTLIEFFLNSNDLKYFKHFKKIKQPRAFLNRKKRKVEQDFISIKTKLHKNKLVYNELLSIQANQSITSQKIEKLLFLCEQEKLINSKTNWSNNNNNDFINFNLNNNNNNDKDFLSKFPYLNIPSNYPFAANDVNIPKNVLESYKNQNNFDNNYLFKTENFSFIPNNSNTDYLNNLNSRKFSPFNNLNKYPSENLNLNNNNDEEDYAYLNTEEANNNPSLLNKNFWMMEKQETQKQLTNTFSNNSHIYDYFSFRIRNSKLNNSNNTLINTINSDANSSVIGHSIKNTNENLSSRINQRLGNNPNSNNNDILRCNKMNFGLNKDKQDETSSNTKQGKKDFEHFDDDSTKCKNRNFNEEDNNSSNLINNVVENSDTNKLPNFYTSRDFNSFILSSQVGKNSEKLKKPVKLNETFSNFTNCNFNKADFSLINQGLSDTFDLGLKKSHSPDNNRLNVLNHKFFEDSDSFKYFNSYRNNLKLMNLTNMHSKSSSNGNTKVLLGHNLNPANELDSSSKDATNKFFELTSNPFNFKLENAGNDAANNINNSNLNNLQSDYDNKNLNYMNKINNNNKKNNEDLEIGFNFSEKLKQNNFENLKKSLELSKNLTTDRSSINNENNKGKNCNNNLENTATAEIKVLSGAKIGSALNMNNQTLRRFKLSGFEDMGKSALGETENEEENILFEIEKGKDQKEAMNEKKPQLEDLNSIINSDSNNITGGNNSDQHLNLFNKFRNKIMNNLNNNLNIELTRKDLEEENSGNFDDKKNNETNIPSYKHSQKSNMEIDGFTIEDKGSDINRNLNNNFQKLKFNNITRNERNSGNSPIISKKRNKRLENLNSLGSNESEKSKNENHQTNKNKPNFEFNYIRKNLEKVAENPGSAKEQSNSLIDLSAIDPNESKKEETGNSNNFDNSLVNSINTDNIISSRKSQDRSLVSGSDVMFDNCSQNSGKFLIDSKDKFKKVRGFNFKNNINTRKFNKPLLSSNNLTSSTNNQNLTTSQSSPKKPFQTKEKLASLASNKEANKSDLNVDKNKDEVSVKNPSNRFNINQQSIDMENKSLDNFDYKDKDKKVSFDSRINCEENFIYDKGEQGLEDLRADKKFNILNSNNLKRRSENKNANK